MKNKQIRKLYDKYNGIIFDNLLPHSSEITIKKNTKMKSWGMCIGYRDLKSIIDFEDLDTKDYEILLNPKAIKRDARHFEHLNPDAVLIHEMIHLWQYFTGKFKSDHDKKFFKWLDKIEKKHGIGMIREFGLTKKDKRNLK